MSEKSVIEKRLTRQLVGKGMTNAAGMAHSLLVKQGTLTKAGGLTRKGEIRNSMTPGERAKARQAKYSGHKAEDFKYDTHTNQATLRRK